VALSPAGPAPAPEPEDAATAALEDAVGLALRVLQVVMLILAALFVVSGVFVVGPSEVGFVRRLGRLDPTPRAPGAHLGWPVLDEVERVDTGATSRRVVETFDLRRTAKDLASGTAEREGGIDPRREGYLVTGDANLVHATLAVQTRIDAPARTLRAFADPGAAVEVLLERAVVQAAAGRPVDDLLGAAKSDVLAEVQAVLARSLARVSLQGDPAGEPAGAGVVVVGVELQGNPAPPPQVRAAFEGVDGAAQALDRLRSEALAAASRIRGDAVAQEARVRSEGRTRAAALRAEAGADAAVFGAQLVEWRRDPRGFEARRLAVTLAEALAKVEECFLVPPGPLRLRLERDAEAIRQELEDKARKQAGR
jgi:membrane protease subunit HflK